MKNCNKCYITKKTSEFYKRPNGSLYAICKLCKNEENRQWYARLSKCVSWRAKESKRKLKYYHERTRNIETNSNPQ